MGSDRLWISTLAQRRKPFGPTALTHALTERRETSGLATQRAIGNGKKSIPDRRFASPLFVIIALIGPLVATADAQLPVVSLRSLSQSIFAPGDQVDVKIAEGEFTEEIRELRFSHPGIRATLLRDPPRPYATH